MSAATHWLWLNARKNNCLANYARVAKMDVLTKQLPAASWAPGGGTKQPSTS